MSMPCEQTEIEAAGKLIIVTNYNVMEIQLNAEIENPVVVVVVIYVLYGIYILK